jgi:four helix bundle protein
MRSLRPVGASQRVSALPSWRRRERRTLKEQVIRVSTPAGSASEVEYQLLLARDLKLLQSKDYDELAQQVTEIKPMLTAFIQKFNAES